MSFDFSRFKTNLFATKAKEEAIAENKTAKADEQPVSFQRYGFRQAGNMNGSIEGLKICLNRVYQEHIAEMRRNGIKQEELRKPFREKLQELTTSKEGLRKQILTIDTDIIP